MTRGAILRREATISAAINAALSLVFFFALFGMRAQIDVSALGRDFFPQAFMVSLMGSLVPALLLRRTVGGGVRPIVVRALVFAVAGAVIAGGGAYAVCSAFRAATVAAGTALIFKAAFGAILGAVVTVCALLPLLPSETRS